MDFSIDGPVTIWAAISGPMRVVNSLQKRSSLQSSTRSLSAHCT